MGLRTSLASGAPASKSFWSMPARLSRNSSARSWVRVTSAFMG